MSITEFVESPGYKKTMGKVYGWGAAVVILGALWKILHLPGANYMLIAGLGTEAIIFFLSAFEPPHAMPDWSLVYPELVGLEPVEHGAGKSSHGGHAGHGGGSDLAALIQSGHLEEDVVRNLADGIKKLTNSTNQLSNLADASLVTDNYLKSMKSASDSVSYLSGTQVKMSESLEQSAAQLSQSYDATAKVITNAGTKMASDLTNSSDQLVSTYTKLTQSISGEAEKISSNSRIYSEQLDGMNKSLSSVNAMFELQLKNSTAQAKASADVTKGLEEILGHYTQSVTDARVYKEQVAKLNQSISELNTIYGNMLSAMNTGVR